MTDFTKLSTRLLKQMLNEAEKEADRGNYRPNLIAVLMNELDRRGAGR